LFEKISLDNIIYLSDYELKKKISKLENLLSYKNNEETATHLQTEMCYLQREAEIRRNRQIAHSAYLIKKNKNRNKNKNYRR